MPSRTDDKLLLDHYRELYFSKHDELPQVNAIIARQHFSTLLDDHDRVYLEELLDYYFQTDGHANGLMWFFNNYQALINSRDAGVEDDKARQQVRQRSNERAAKWRADHPDYAGIPLRSTE